MAAWLRSLPRLLAVCKPLLLAVLLTMAGFVPLASRWASCTRWAAAGGSGLELFVVLDWMCHQGPTDEDMLASLLLANLTIASFGLIAASAPRAIGRGRARCAAALLSATYAAPRPQAARSESRGCNRAVWENCHVSSPSPAAAPSSLVALERAARGHCQHRAARGSRRHSRPGARGVLVGTGWHRPEPRWAHRRGPVAAQPFARPQLDPAAARCRRTPAVRADAGRWPRPRGNATRARCARSAPHACHLLLHRHARAGASCGVARDRRARPRRAEPQPLAPPRLRTVGAARAGPRSGACTTSAGRLVRRTATLLSRASRVAQSVPRSGAAPPRPQPGELDSTRLRYRLARYPACSTV